MSAVNRSLSAYSTVSRFPDIATDTVLGLGELQKIEAEVMTQRGNLPGQSRIRAGESPTVWHGQGMEPIETRAYQAGDDIRHLDWRATARSGKPRSKVFADERRHSLALLIDYRPTMHFASAGELKSRCACRCAALLAFAALKRREPVTALVLHGQGQITHYPETQQLGGIIALLQGTAAPGIVTVDSDTPMATALQRMTAWTRPASMLTLISDLHDSVDQERALGQQLAVLAARQSVRLLQLLDTTEMALPPSGRLRLLDDAGRVIVINSDDSRLRQDYARIRGAQRQRLQQQCQQYGIDYQLLLTTDSLSVSEWLSERRGRVLS